MYVQNGPNKGRPICSHCNRVAHIAERCYRKHGFPLGFTLKGKSTSDKQKITPVAAQVTFLTPVSEKDVKSVAMENLVGNLTKDQIQSFIAYFSYQLQNQTVYTAASTSNAASGIDLSPSTYYFVGILTVSQHPLSNQTWVNDSGATHHVSHDQSLFISLDTSVMSLVNLPTGHTIQISGIGTI